jgi:hypothetical protein
MTARTRRELQWCIEHLSHPNREDPDGIRRGLEDWFFSSLLEDGLLAESDLHWQREA